MIHCVARQWGFAHVCDACGAVGPIVGAFPEILDLAEAGIRCPGDGTCAAARAGWLIGERDLCPKCTPKTIGQKIMAALAELAA